MATKTESPAFIYAALGPKKFLVQRLTVGRSTSYRPFATTEHECHAQRIVAAMTADGPAQGD